MDKPSSHSASADDPLAMFEVNLARSLRPVPPRPEFVKKLGRRILSPPGITMERRTEMKAFLFIALGLFSGILLIWLLIRLARFFGGTRETA